jgi:hypothetical protein
VNDLSVHGLPISQPEDVLRVLEEQVKRDSAPPRVKRDAHPKMHGCVQAELTVDPALSEELRLGIFGQPRRFKAWIRFSNAFRIRHDLEFQTRGMAIKLLEVEGPKLSEDEQRTQDFLLATHDAFFLPDGQHYGEFAQAVGADPPNPFGFFKRHHLWRAFYQMMRSSLVLARNPLAVPYFSQTPYRLGDHVVKLQARPVLAGALEDSLPARWWFLGQALIANGKLALNPGRAQAPAAEEWCDRHLDSRYFLRHSMMAFLARHEASFDLLVQRRKDSRRMPIDDATRRWPERISPFERVATIRIPRQRFWPDRGMPERVMRATIEMMELGENMSFNPWHALVEHEPLGAINQMRRRIYPGIATLRRQLNGVTPVEPDVAQYDRLKAIVQDWRALLGSQPLP